METTDVYHSHFHKYNEENLRVCVSKLEMGKLLIFPSNSTYIIGVNALNNDSKDFLKEITKTKDEELIMFGLSWDLLRLLFPITNDLYNKINDLIQRYPSDEMVINFKINKINYKICLPKDPIFKRILELFKLPIIGTKATNLQYGFDCINTEMTEFTFKNYGIDVLLNDNPCKYAIDYTYINVDIDNDLPTIYIPGFNFNLFNKYCKININPEYNNNINFSKKKKSFMFNFIDFDNSTNDKKEYNNEIQNAVMKYLTNSIVIDFNGKNKILSFKAAAYVDLSVSGDINEALFNIHNVLYQTIDVDIYNILFFDYYSNKNEYIQLYYIIYKYCEGKQLVIPYQCFTDEERERWAYSDIDNELIEYERIEENERIEEQLEDYQEKELDIINEE